MGEHIISVFSPNGPDEGYGYRFWVNADPDKDGYSTDLENFMGTDTNLNCGVNSSGKNAWSPDVNNDKKVKLNGSTTFGKDGGKVLCTLYHGSFGDSATCFGQLPI